MSASWTLKLPCTRAEAEALNSDIPELAMLDPQPVILTEELVPFDDARWQLTAYFGSKPGKAAVATIQSLVPSARKTKPVIERVPDADWVTQSQAGIAPIHAGRFYVHTASNNGRVPPGAVAFQIEASRAFGTGSHETTAGCLSMLDAMKRRGARFGHVADIGTGTGLLAFAANHLWPSAEIIASDIDPISIEIARENASVNGIAPRRIALCVAAGTNHQAIIDRAPYDLLIANILAGPLIALAPAFAGVIGEGGTLILAGLLNTQAEAVTRAYRRVGFRLAERADNGDWPCLRLVMRANYGWKRLLRDTSGRAQAPGDFGTW